jgi:hypothetical protein
MNRSPMWSVSQLSLVFFAVVACAKDAVPLPPDDPPAGALIIGGRPQCGDCRIELERVAELGGSRDSILLNPSLARRLRLTRVDDTS